MAPNNRSGHGEHWVVVGAGSAGCVIAGRLSEDPSRSVTLIDDGPPLQPGEVPVEVAGPNFFEALRLPGRVHENLLATRTPGSAPAPYHRGRGIGGSSTVNAMVALRGSPALYSSWGWSDVDAAFDRVESPLERPSPDEIGVVDKALLAADDRAELVELTRRAGRRVTAAEAYLWPALERPNLTVHPNTEVEAVTFSGRSATGIRCANGDHIIGDRVVLAAGAIHSPVILLRSGVDTVGVGRNLQDHPSAVFGLQYRDEVDQGEAGLAIGSVLHTTIDGQLVQLLSLNHLGPTDDAPMGALMVALMTPVGRDGSVTIDDDGKPVIDFALLTHPEDLDGLAKAVMLGMDVLRHRAFTEIVSDVFVDDLGTPLSRLDDEQAITSWIRSNCGDYVHATSTCAMGTVVDERFAVYGHENLFVCDASVFPSIPDANTHLPTTMLAERFALRHC